LITDRPNFKHNKIQLLNVLLFSSLMSFEFSRVRRSNADCTLYRHNLFDEYTSWLSTSPSCGDGHDGADAAVCEMDNAIHDKSALFQKAIKLGLSPFSASITHDQHVDVKTAMVVGVVAKKKKKMSRVGFRGK